MSPDRFAQLRHAAGLSQEGLASLWGLHRTTIADWERGERPVPTWAARLIAWEAWAVT